MSRRHPGLAVAAAAAVVVAGVTGATVAYQAVAAAGASSAGGDAHGHRPPGPASPSVTPNTWTRVRFHPCPPRTRLERGACVRHVTRVVDGPATPPPNPRPTPTSGGR